MKKEFEVGDKVVIEGVVIKNDLKIFGEYYPISVIFNDNENSACYYFNINGAGRTDGITIKHAPKESEYPKWMMVSNDNIFWCKRYIINKINDKYLFISFVESEMDIRNILYSSSVIDNINIYSTLYAKDIEEFDTIKKQELLTKADELIQQSNVLVKKAEEIKKQANNL